MAEVGDGGRLKRALGALKEEVVRGHQLEDGLHVLEVLGPRSTVNQYIIKENEHEPSQEWPRIVVYDPLEHGCYDQ